MKRLITLGLAALLVLAACAGCANTPAPSAADTATAAPVASAPSGADASQAPEAPDGEMTQFTVTYGGLDADPSEHAMGQFIKEKFGLSFVPVDTEAEKLQLLATADDLPDVVNITVGDPLYTLMREDGQIRAIPEDMLSKYPFLYQLSQDAMLTSGIYRNYGSYYNLPMRNDADTGDVVWWLAFMYRTDWASKVGIDAAPTDMVAFADMLRKFTFDDPTGTGAQTYGYSGWIFGACFYPWVDYDHWVYENGQWIPGNFSQGAREGLIYWNNLYKEGVIDPEFATGDNVELLVTDKIGVINRRYDEFGIRDVHITKFGPAHPDLDPLETIKHIPPMSVDGTQEPTWNKDIDDRYGRSFSAKVDDEKLERLLMFAEWLYSEEGRRFRNLGIEGVDWIEEDGMATNLLPEGTTLSDKYQGLYCLDIAGWGYQTALQVKNPAYPPEVTAAYQAQQDEARPYLVDFNPEITIASSPAKDAFNVDTGSWENRYMEIISTSGDPGAEFDAYIQELRDIYNFDAMLQEINAMFPAP